MATVGHIAVGLAAGRWLARSTGRSELTWTAMETYVLVSLLPISTPSRSASGHLTERHSDIEELLTPCLWAAAIAALASLLAPHRRLSPLRVGLLTLAVAASHGLLDTLTDGGSGIALLWPLSDQRFFAPWRPLPVAPIGLRLLSRRGFHVMLFETSWFSPLLAYAFWPRRLASRGADRLKSGRTTRPELPHPIAPARSRALASGGRLAGGCADRFAG